MTKQFLVRADLAFGLLGGVPGSTVLPVKLGPFQLDHSPNADLGQIEPHQFSLSKLSDYVRLSVKGKCHLGSLPC